MGEIAKLGYVGFETPAYEQWRTWGPDVLGCMLGPDGADGAVRLKIDEADHRLSFHPGEEHRLAYVGWEVLDHRDLAAAAERLERAGAKPEPASDATALARGVDRLFTFTDPLGMPGEVFCYQQSGYRDWNPPRPHRGFLTGEQGLGHIVFVVPDAHLISEWYMDALDLRLSDRITLPEPMKDIYFLRANPRHHSVAFLEMPGRLGVHHVYLETNSLDDVGYSYYEVLGGDTCADLVATLGRHVADQTISYYVRTPSGFAIEYGWDGLPIDDRARRSAHIIDTRAGKPGDLWGHKYRHQPNEMVREYTG